MKIVRPSLFAPIIALLLALCWSVAGAASLKLIFTGGVVPGTATACSATSTSCLYRNVVYDQTTNSVLPASNPYQRDAIVSVVNQTRASLYAFDESPAVSATTPNPNGDDNFFQPRVRRANETGTSGWVRFKFTFYAAGSTGTPTTVKGLDGTVYISALDIDRNTGVSEGVTVFGAAQVATSTNPATALVQLTTPWETGGTTYQANGRLGTGIDRADDLKLSIVYKDVSTFDYSLGSQLDNGGSPYTCPATDLTTQCVRLGAVSFDRLDALPMLAIVDGYKSVKLTNDADGSGTVTPGDTLTWTITYVNTGNANVTGFQISDPLPPGVSTTGAGAQTVTAGTGSVATKNAAYTGAGTAGAAVNNLLASATLAANSTLTVSIPVTVGSAAAGTTLGNQASASGTATAGPNPSAVLSDNVDTTTVFPPSVRAAAGWTAVPNGSITQTATTALDPTTVVVPKINADLAVDKSVSAAAVGSGGTVTYTLRVWNNGSGTTSAATVSDPLPSGLTNSTVTCAATGTAVCGTQAVTSGTLTATTGSLPVDAPTTTGPDTNYLTYTITATAPANGQLSNTAGVTVNTATTNDGTAGNNTSGAVTTRVIDAVNDAAVNLAYGAGGTISVLGNDMVGGGAATTGNATVTIGNNGGLTGLAVSGGQVVVPTSAAPGTYTVTYSLCDATVTAACDTATVTVTVAGPTAGNPFVCDGTLYQIKYLSTGGTNNSQLFRIVRSTSPYTVTQIGAISPLQTLNGLGYNVQDNYLYALASTTSATTALYRIGQSNAESLGPITLRTGGTLTGYAVSAGTIDGSGTMYLMPQGTTNTLYKVNLSTREATPVPLTYSGGAVPQFGDFAIHPRDGKLYGLGVNGDTTLYIVDLSTGTVTSKALAGTLPSGASFGTVFFDAVGELYGYTNTGAFFHVNTATGAATQLSTADATNTSDGASCVYRSERLDVVKQAGTVTHPSNLVYTVPYTATFKNTGTVSVAGVQITDILSSTFAAGSPTITVTSAPSVTAGGCTANSAFDGSGDTRLLTGADTLAVGASCTVKFTVRVQYPSVASIPTAPLNNSMYASGAYDSYSPSQKNGGYVVVNGVLIPPPNVSLLDTSTNGATLPPTANGDTPSPTPVTLPRTPTVTLGKLVRNIGASLSSTSGTFGTSATGKPGDYLEYCIAYGNSGTTSALNMSVEDTVAATGPANVNGYGSGLGVLFADGATLASGATAAPSGTTLTSAADGDKATLTATSLNFNVGSLAAGGGGVVCFKAQVP